MDVFIFIQVRKKGVTINYEMGFLRVSKRL